ncbi:MAG: helix-hairpin-helix domain-containing protein [Saprospiraceae bacterium]|nr:helix-hairpin-helix domain-containing protein [Saprospiraceae bacterium]
MIWQASLSTCTFTWWEHLIWTLIPFLLGLLLGYLLWYRYRHRVVRMQSEETRQHEEADQLGTEVKQQADTIAGLEARIAKLESDLSASRLAYSTLQNRHNALQKLSQQPTPVVAAVAAAVRKDPLTRIEGIGPKTQELLYDREIQSFVQLAGTRVTTLRKILSEAGPNFSQIDPGTWPKQAKLAARAEWKKLRTYQDRLIGGREPSKVRTDPDVSGTKEVFGKAIKLNDFKLIEGIGPKIEQLLKKAGISTWWDLADASVKSIQEILDQAGPRYRLADPGTWPKQARLAAKGDWKKLKAYQDELDGGRKV